MERDRNKIFFLQNRNKGELTRSSVVSKDKLRFEVGREFCDTFREKMNLAHLLLLRNQFGLLESAAKLESVACDHPLTLLIMPPIRGPAENRSPNHFSPANAPPPSVCETSPFGPIGYPNKTRICRIVALFRARPKGWRTSVKVGRNLASYVSNKRHKRSCREGRVARAQETAAA